MAHPTKILGGPLPTQQRPSLKAVCHARTCREHRSATRFATRQRSGNWTSQIYTNYTADGRTLQSSKI